MKTLYKWYLTNEGIVGYMAHGVVSVSYTHLTLPTKLEV